MAENDPDRYEFDAPSYVVDLKALEEDKNQDKWFEQQAAGAGYQLFTPSRPDGSFVRNADNLPTAVVAPQVKTEAYPGVSTSMLPNMVTSWGAGAPAQVGAQAKRTTAKPPTQPRRVSKRKEPTSSLAAPPIKKYKKSPVTRTIRKPISVRRNGKLNSRNSPKTKAAALSTNTDQSTFEEQELAKIRKLQKEVALHCKKNEASYKATLAGRTCTKPKPFNLSMGNKRKLKEPGAYVSMAQQIEQFYRRTPDRYHVCSRKSRERGPSPVKRDRPKLTRSRTPHLLTRWRNRPRTAKSNTELEAEESDKLERFKFRALGLNRKILESTETLDKPAVEEPTVPEAFELHLEKRLQERHARKKPQEAEEKPHIFHAKPLPKKILEGVVGLPEKKVAQPTVPESPAFVLSTRVRMENKAAQVRPQSPIKAPPVPHFGLPFQPQLPHNHHVEVCPFSFEEREQQRRALKEKRLQEDKYEEVPKFKAQPLPDFSAVVLPEKKKLEPTKPEPFKLLVDERGTVKISRLEQMLEEEKKRQVEVTLFKARPSTVVHKEPFQPKKENHRTLVVEAFELATERRARERQEYEQLISEKEALRAQMEEEQRREGEQREKEDIARLRQEQVHKAQPIRHYKTVKVKKSEVPLTVPHSPNFSDRFHL